MGNDLALAIIGIPGAHGLHGYVGFVFGSLKSREWWSSDLMPAIFLFSAIISGTALVIVLYVVSCKLRKVPIDLPCLKVMAYSLWGFMMFTLLLEGVEFASLVYRGREGYDVIMQFVEGPLLIPFFVLQFGIGSVLPLAVITFFIWRGANDRALVVGVYSKRSFGTARGADDALQRGHRRARNLQDGQRIARLSPAHPGQGGPIGGGHSANSAAYLVVGIGPISAAVA